MCRHTRKHCKIQTSTSFTNYVILNNVNSIPISIGHICHTSAALGWGRGAAASDPQIHRDLILDINSVVSLSMYDIIV
jgi:hypothetical protein